MSELTPKSPLVHVSVDTLARMLLNLRDNPRVSVGIASDEDGRILLCLIGCDSEGLLSSTSDVHCCVGRLNAPTEQGLGAVENVRRH